MRAGSLLLVAAATLACGISPPPPPVPVQGRQDDVTELSGKWSGRYWSKETGRHGVIRFTLPEHADSGYGEVEITFSPALHLLREPTADEALETEPCTVIDIRVVRVEGDRIRGTMVPYWDPDCDCRATTVFEGKFVGTRIAGTFTTRRASTDRRLLAGQWEVTRGGGKS